MNEGRWTADADGDVVVFIIGFHINRWRAVREWLPVGQAMPRMLRELQQQPELGMLGANGGWFFGGPGFIQYWRSYAHLEAYARKHDSEHLPAWRAFNRAARRSSAVGIYHETFRVGDGSWEAIYRNMPAVGLLGAVGGRPVSAASTSATRIGDRATDTAPVEI